jgi:DNA processing protein
MTNKEVNEMNLREQACWLSLVFESKLSTRIVNGIIATWCKQLGRTLQDFFTADANEWNTTCHLSADIIHKIEQAKAKLVGQAFLAEQLQNDHIHMMTVLDPEYPTRLKSALTRSQIPSVLFYAGDLTILERQTIAIIGSRNASEVSLDFTRNIAQYFAEHGANVISGNARGVDRIAYEGVIHSHGYTTVVLPHGVRKVSKTQMRDLHQGIDAGKVLLMSQFQPDAPWLVSRAMDRNNVVTGLAQVVIVAESDSKGGTWEGANGALKQGRSLYVRHTPSSDILAGNELLIKKGGIPLAWPTEDLTGILSPILQKSAVVQTIQRHTAPPPNQLSLLAVTHEQL